MSVRDERAAAITRRYRDLSDNFTRALPGLLDELENIDRANVPDMVAVKNGLDPTDAELTAWVRAHDREFSAWVAKQDRIHGDGGVLRVLGGTAPAEQAAAPAKPATRRRRTT